MTKDNFILLFTEILQREFAKYLQESITGYKAIDVIGKVFDEYEKK